MRLPPVEILKLLQMMKSIGLNFSEIGVIKADGIHQYYINDELGKINLITDINKLLTYKLNIYEKKNYLFGFAFISLQRSRQKQKIRNN